MKKSLIATTVALASLASLSAHALTKDITVTANVDSTIAITALDGGDLPDTVKMSFDPSKGLKAFSEQVKFYSNDASKDVTVGLAYAPKLSMVSDNTVTKDLNITLGGKTLTTAGVTLTAKDLFGNGVTGAKASVAEELIISGKDDTKAMPAGTYSGVVSLVIGQAAAAA